MKRYKNKKSPFRAFGIILIAVLIVGGVSLLPLEELTGGRIKGFNLLADIMEKQEMKGDEDESTGDEMTDDLDPELVAAMKADNDMEIKLTDSIKDVPAADKDRKCVDTDSVIIAAKPSKVDGKVLIEDYTSHQNGLKNLRASIEGGGMSRIAVLGDSYIEGDIFTQDLRDQLQGIYGGSGVGYVNMLSQFPGFRKSVRQSGKGWTEFAINKKCNRNYMGVSQHYFTPKGTATSTYKGSNSFNHTGQWENSMFLFVAPDGGTVKARTGEEWSEFDIDASDEVQSIRIPGTASKFEIETSSPGLIGLGVWLDGSRGISVDCMSTRGNSGLTLKGISADLCRRMTKFIDYKLIIIEFGINAMSHGQTNYSAYKKYMIDVVNKVKACYPGSDILVMGIGDRGEKRGGAIHSMVGTKNMVEAQRDVARQTHSLFWDTKEAMGGEDAIVKWSGNGWANKDYVHLTHKGGKQLATEMVNAIKTNLNR